MEKVLFGLWNVSYRAAIVIVAVLIVRRVLMRKFPARYSYYLWGLVALSLIVPLGISSPISLYNIVPDGGTVVNRIAPDGIAKYADSQKNGKSRSDQADSETQSEVSEKWYSDSEATDKNKVAGDNAVTGGNTASNNNTVTDSNEATNNNTVTDSDAASGKNEATETDSNAASGNNTVNDSNTVSDKNDVSEKKDSGDSATKQEQTVSGKEDSVADQGSDSNALTQKKGQTEKGKTYQIVFVIWLTGMVLGLAYMIVRALQMRKKLHHPKCTGDGVYECEGLPSPFVFGILHPIVYLPTGLERETKDYLLSHEKYHIARKDYLIKWAASILLAIYWFHPLVWVAYVMMERDMEMSCDEFVLKDSSGEMRIKYSESLLQFATRKPYTPGQLAFGAHTTKHRVKNVLSAKHAKKYMGALIAVLVVVLAAVFLTTGNGSSFFKGDSAKNKKQAAVKNDDLVALDLHCDNSDYYGEVEGWFGQILADRFGVKLTISIQDTDEMEKFYETDTDIFLTWTKNLYQDAVKQNRLVKLANDDYAYSPQTDNEYERIPAWYLRYDLYEECGSPKIKDFDDFLAVAKKMKEKAGADYAFSGYSEEGIEEAAIAPVNNLLSYYFGYAAKGTFLLENAKGEEEDLLGLYTSSESKDGAYVQSLKMWNRCYREGLLDPKAQDNTYDDMLQKLKDGKGVCTISSGTFYNEEHSDDGKAMYPVVPDKALIATTKLQCHDPWLSVNAGSDHVDLAKRVVDYLGSTLGMMEMSYGPKGLCWDYDNDGKAYLTALGEQCKEDSSTVLQTDDQKYAAYNGMNFADGVLPLNFRPYHSLAKNPDNGETFDADGWSLRAKQVEEKLDQENPSSLWTDWKKNTKAKTMEEYVDQGKHFVIHSETSEKELSDKSDSWLDVCVNLQENAWKAIYAKNDQQFEERIQKMIRDAKQDGYEECYTYEKEHQ